MVVKDDDVLELFRCSGYCEVCWKYCKVREPHHIHSRGAGQLDIPENLVATGSTRGFQCDCHTKIHNGKIGRLTLLVIAGDRECMLVEDIEELVWELRRLPKKGRMP